MTPEIVYGDILKQDVEVIVNAWNRNIIPWWLLLPQGVSGAIKKKGGYAPFKELAKFGPIPLGEARRTSAGTLPFQAIIHVAGINIFWVATQYSVSNAVKNAMNIVKKEGYRSVAFPLIGAGSGNRNQEWSLGLMLETFKQIETPARVAIVRYRKNT
ncbi:MAG: macro domain-containing protein [Candidatus Electrothrix aestuarii]|uniref:Macro domain-containing protein n=1 Tax=Candidatus Electrothrix aestuarii TaxID=3062594 RepID=A0AAU8LWQ8_9BACT|nr:macro domain-containing protein [Candidatus Electrothrix aestuarii]